MEDKNTSIAKSKLLRIITQNYKTLQNFPKYERFCLCREIRNSFYQAINALDLAGSVKSKRREYLQIAEAHLLTLQTHFLIARNNKYISKNRQRNLDYELTEVKIIVRSIIKTNKS